MRSYFIVLILALSSTSICQAQNEPSSDSQRARPAKDEGAHRKPPQHAFELCKGKKEGDIVQITTPRGKKLEGVCTPSKEGLFARPEHPPREEKEERKPRKPS